MKLVIKEESKKRKILDILGYSEDFLDYELFLTIEDKKAQEEEIFAEGIINEGW